MSFRLVPKSVTLNGVMAATCIWAIAGYDRHRNNISVCVLLCDNISNHETVFIIKVT